MLLGNDNKGQSCVFEKLFFLFQATKYNKGMHMKKKYNEDRKKREELRLTIKIEVDNCPGPGV